MQPRPITRVATSLNFRSRPSRRIRCGAVHENQKADQGPDSLWEAAQDAILKEAQAAGLISE